jgi:hypothetical protein
VNHELVAAVSNHADHLEQRPAASWPEIEPQVLIEIIDRHGVANRVLDVVQEGPMLERRLPNFHTLQSYYETFVKTARVPEHPEQRAEPLPPIAGSGTSCHRKRRAYETQAKAIGHPL